MFKACFIDVGSMSNPRAYIFFSFLLYIYLSVEKYNIVKALELYKNMMAIMTKDGFDTAQLVNVNKTNLFCKYRNISLYLNISVV